MFYFEEENDHLRDFGDVSTIDGPESSQWKSM